MVEAVGTCYEDAWRFLLKEEEGELIHGSVQLSAEGPRVNHAWVELPTGWVWEPQTKSYFTIEDFKIMAPLEEHRYSVTEAAVMLARVGKHGPWTEQERQMLKRGNPDAKKPWQMTLAEYKKTLVKPGDRVAWGNHYVYVKQALLDGLTVPPEVLADYPELRKYEIPKTKVASLGFIELELPVARAVEALTPEDDITRLTWYPWSSGFHGALNQRWTIVFRGKASDKVVKAAEAAGLEVSYREAPIGSGQILTDVSLPDVGVTEIEKATETFNRFADLYEGLEGGNPEDNDKRLLKVAIEHEPLRVAKQLGYEIHRLSPKDIVDKDDYARGYRYRLSKTDLTQPYPQIVMARSESEVATFLKRQIEGNPGTLYLEEGERIARQLGNGVIYDGSQMYHDKIYTHFFTDAAVTGTTFACLDLVECKATLIQSRKDFGAAPPTFGGNPDAKEPWQMTKEEFAEVYPFKAGAEAVHRSAVFGAIYQGKPVPAEVLADYPDLKPKGDNPIIHEAITESPDPTKFMPVEVASAFPASAKSILSPEEQARVDAFIEAVPDKNDTRAINYWVDLGDKKVYLEGWCDKCLVSTGFPKIGGGEWDEKIQYMTKDTKRTLREKQEESNRPFIGPGHWPLIEGGFREFEAGDRGWLYGVTWGVYTKPETPVVSEPIAFEKRLEHELKRKGFTAEPKGDNPMAKTEQERLSFHERIFGKGSTSPLERLGGGQVVNDLLPMPPESGPPLPRALGIRWPWKR